MNIYSVSFTSIAIDEHGEHLDLGADGAIEEITTKGVVDCVDTKNRD